MTDTKAIKDIGREKWVSPTWSTATAACPLHDEAKLEACGYSPALYYTKEERRELVRRVWDAALDHCEFDSFSGPRVTKSPDEFIKENDL